MINIFMISSDEKRLLENEVYQKLKNTLNIEIISTEKQTNPEKGCYDAHYLVAKIAAQRNLNYYICLEDNAALNKFDLDKFHQTIDYVKKEHLPLVYLAKMPKIMLGKGIIHYGENIYSNYSTTNGTVAYMMSNKIRNKFLKYPYDSVKIPVDDLFKKLITQEYFAYPTPFRRRNGCKSIVNNGGIRTMWRKIYYHPIFYNLFSFIEMNEGIIGVIVLLLIIILCFSSHCTNLRFY